MGSRREVTPGGALTAIDGIVGGKVFAAKPKTPTIMVAEKGADQVLGMIRLSRKEAHGAHE